MNFLCMFLLSLMDEESAFWTLGYIVTQLLPSNFFGQTENGSQLIGYQQEKFVLANLMKDNLGLTPDVSSKITTILDVNGSALINTLLINSTCFEVSFEAWNKMLLNQSVCEKKFFFHLNRLMK